MVRLIFQTSVLLTLKDVYILSQSSQRCECNNVWFVLLFCNQFLCESQFDENFKFKAIVNDEDPDKMRTEPMGRDKMGLVYWFQKV